MLDFCLVVCLLPQVAAAECLASIPPKIRKSCIKSQAWLQNMHKCMIIYREWIILFFTAHYLAWTNLPVKKEQMISYSVWIWQMHGIASCQLIPPVCGSVFRLPEHWCTVLRFCFWMNPPPVLIPKVHKMSICWFRNLPQAEQLFSYAHIGNPALFSTFIKAVVSIQNTGWIFSWYDGFIHFVCCNDAYFRNWNVVFDRKCVDAWH